MDLKYLIISDKNTIVSGLYADVAKSLIGYGLKETMGKCGLRDDIVSPLIERDWEKFCSFTDSNTAVIIADRDKNSKHLPYSPPFSLEKYPDALSLIKIFSSGDSADTVCSAITDIIPDAVVYKRERNDFVLQK